MNILSENLKLLRKEKKLSQKVIANKLNIKTTTYASYEYGTEPPLSILIELSNIFEVSVDYILKGNQNLSYIKSYKKNEVNEEQAEYKTKNKTNEYLQKELGIAKARIETMEHLFDKLLDKIEIKTK